MFKTKLKNYISTNDEPIISDSVRPRYVNKYTGELTNTLGATILYEILYMPSAHKFKHLIPYILGWRRFDKYYG